MKIYQCAIASRFSELRVQRYGEILNQQIFFDIFLYFLVKKFFLWT